MVVGLLNSISLKYCEITSYMYCMLNNPWDLVKFIGKMDSFITQDKTLQTFSDVAGDNTILLIKGMKTFEDNHYFLIIAVMIINVSFSMVSSKCTHNVQRAHAHRCQTHFFSCTLRTASL